MNPQQYNKIFKILSKEQEPALILVFSSFYDKSLGDGDIVANLEEEIKCNQKKLSSNTSEGDLLVRKIIDKLLCRIYDSVNNK